MVRLGKTYGNLMVDLKATNVKLRERATRMVCAITGATRERAVEALESTGYNVKLAAISVRFGIDAVAATHRLQQAEGRLRIALEERS
jgi:N-acetylmuramic acid 6-phosphate etherase